MVTFDSNIAVYALIDDPPKTLRSQDVLAASDFVSVQVLNEVTNVLVRKRRLSWEIAATYLAALYAVAAKVAPLTYAAHEGAVRIAGRYQLQFYDALLIAVALANGATTLYSEDLQHGLVIDGRLTVRNPFRQDVVIA